jgi:pimeloyl-ACP methyl ester carboxylesterase
MKRTCPSIVGTPTRNFRSSEIGPLAIAKQGYLFTGGAYFETDDGEFLSGQMYAEYQIPVREEHRFPIVMFAGGSQSGVNYMGTPDGRDGWAQFFLSRGFAVFVTDQPARGRSAYHPDAAGPVRRSNVRIVEDRFSAPERAGLWPQAKLHTQWPGGGLKGEAVFDQFMAQELPSLASLARQPELNQRAGAALLDEIGPAILLTHSQAGPFGWLLADARPDLVKAIVAIEPNGPPLRDLVPTGRADRPFEDGEITRPYGLTAAPLAYDPAVKSADDLRFLRLESSEGPEISHGWLQADPPRALPNLKGVPILVLQAEASYHAPYDCWTVNYLRQAGVDARFTRLADIGIRGNAHMMMLERNNLRIAEVIAHWLSDIGL